MNQTNFALKEQPAIPSFNFGRNEEIKLTDVEFLKWRSYIYELCGIYFQDNKKYLLESRLLKRIRFLNLKSYDEYFSYIKFRSNGNELKYLYEVITINETYFFRNQPQLDALVKFLIPEILNSPHKLNKNKIRIWSAASSSGEEAYSIAMLFNEMIKPKFPNVQLEIIGTDINYSVVETAKKGIYKEYSVRNTPAYFIKKYFVKEDNQYMLKPEIKSMAQFNTLNLSDEKAMKMMRNFDVIFCANVLIYFDLKSKIKVVTNLYDSLNKNGYLFIGYSETLHGVSKAFKLKSYPKTIGYKKE